ncbi:DUF2721 domain-containing protein [Croceicoccus mobilis]|uniref:DUF2721 domain-containing protein n=1 Tax=Croceicoccus mobilis TaxID=1703339 RepID=A0A917DP11_9SPHN|nr:DUF2721 domain-containing protein [Croceicoccus mobilis]GGD57272.1 hypothetical protein GCM10010990_03110 [Croceicoccus mobilis]
MIAQTIQLALAPVFVLVAIGNILNLLAGRLARVVDRARVLQVSYKETEGAEHDEIVREIRTLDKRIAMINRAILLLVVSGVMIGLTVLSIFLTTYFFAHLGWLDGFFFLIALSFLMTALVTFLAETRLASSTLRIPEALLELDRRL